MNVKKTKTGKSSKRRYAKRNRKFIKKSKALAISKTIRSFQVLNKINKVYRFKESIDPAFSVMIGTGNPIAYIDTFQISQLARYTAVASLFRQVRVERLIYRFTLLTKDYTDNTTNPTIFIRYNYDPDLTAGGLSQDFMERQTNVVKKTFSHETPEGQTFSYSLKPATMVATKLWNSPNYVPSPIWSRWIDVDPSTTTSEIVHFGLQYYIPYLEGGQKIECTLEVHYSCRDLI